MNPWLFRKEVNEDKNPDVCMWVCFCCKYCLAYVAFWVAGQSGGTDSFCEYSLKLIKQQTASEKKKLPLIEKSVHHN